MDTGGVGIEEEVAVVHVQGADVVAVLVHADVLHQPFLVINVALLDVEDLAEQFGRVFGVPHKVDVAEIVARSFVNGDVDVGEVAFHVEGVFHDVGIAETELVVFLYQLHLVALIVGLDELGTLETVEVDAPCKVVAEMLDYVLGAVVVGVLEHVGDDSVGFPERGEVESLLGLFHGTEQHGIRDAVVAVDGDFFNLDLLGLMDVEQEVDCVFHLLVGDLRIRQRVHPRVRRPVQGAARQTCRGK